MTDDIPTERPGALTAALLRALLDEVPALVGILAPDGTLIELNRPALACAAPALGAALGKPLWEAAGWDDAPQTRARLREAVSLAAGGAPQRLELAVQTPGGTGWLDLRIGPLCDTAGRLTHLSLTGLDLTERRTAEARLSAGAPPQPERTCADDEPSASRGRLADFAAATFEGIVISEAGRILDCNPQLERMLDYPPGSLAGRLIEDLVAPEHRERVMEAVQLLHTSHLEHEVLRRDGSRIVVEVRGLPDTTGGTGRRFTVLRDITERKRAEEALRAAHDTFYHLVQNSPFGVYTVDADFRLAQVSHGAQQVFANVRPLLGRDFAQVLRCLWSEPFATDAIARFRHTLATGEPYHSPGTVARRRDNEALESYDWKTERITLPDGRPGVVCHFYDLSERLHYEEALRDADRRKDELLATLAHELRNPLAPIRTGLEVLQLAGADPATAAPVIAMMKRQLHHLVRLVDDLLDIARITHGKIALRKEPVDLAETVAAALESAGLGAADGGRRLTTSLPDTPLLVEGDPVRLAQVIGNLLSNAVKFTREDGEIRLCVARESGPDADWARISVRDDGEGIAPGLTERIFDMFSQANPHRGGGLGIGLALAHRLVELHGGRIEAHSAGPGQGSEFIVRLPLAGAAHLGPSAALPAGGAALRARRVLVVDDSRDNADSTAVLLSALGAAVCVAYDGAAALAAAAAERPDTVLLDLGMPGLDGYEVARRLRAQFPGPQLQLVALTGWGDADDRRRVLAAGFDQHLIKPASIESLKAILDTRPNASG